jgi:sec-independent protein translocase protein TatC
MTLFEHIGELRRRLVICLVAVAIGAIVCYTFYGPILDFLRHPYCEAFHKRACPALIITAPLQGFSARLDVCGYGGLILGLPVILWETWRFITPGLKANERKYALPFVFATVLLFAAGGLTAYEIFPKGIGFLVRASGPGVLPFLTIQSYVTLISLLILVFGLAFEYPAVLVGLELAGVVSTAALRRVRRYAFLVVIIISALVTPSSDPFSMLALALPLTIFYEAAILIGRLCGK